MVTVTHATVTGAAANPNVLVDGPSWDAEHVITGSIREVLAANRTYYVRADGTDSNTGLLNTAAGAFATIPKAYDTIADTLDLAGHVVTIQISNGTYASGLVTAKGVVGGNGPASVVIQGSPTPSNVVIAVTSQDAFGIGETAFGAGTSGQTQITIAGVKITTTTAGNAINASGGGVAVTVGLPGYPVEFGTCAQSHIVGNHNAWVIAGTNNLVSGGATIHAAALSNSIVALHGTTLTFSNSPVFTFFAYADVGGRLYVDAMTFTNKATVTGTRYLAASEGLVYALGNASYLPGNVAGFEYEGGKYVADVGAAGIPNYTSGILSYIVPAAGIATFLTTPSSANLASALTDENGTAGSVVFSISPTFTGVPAAPTAAVDTNTTQLATTAMVLAQLAASAPLAVTNTAVVGTSTRFARADHVHAYESAAWTSYTPTITSQGGTLTGTTITPTGRYKQIGKTVIVEMDIALTNVGSGSPTGGVRATLPVTAAAFRYTTSVYEYSATGKAGAGYINGPVSPTYVSLSDYSGATFWVNGYNLAMTMTYEVP